MITYGKKKEGIHMSNVYENCPTLENNNYIIRLIDEKDAADLLKVYSDKRALPFFNSDNCNGSNFYNTSLDNMIEAIKYWMFEYNRKGFVRFSIVDKHSNEVIGTIELFNRIADDYYTNCGLLRLDIRYDYEEHEQIRDILSVMLPVTLELFECSMIATKASLYAIERREALSELGFSESSHSLVGHDGTKYYNYWVYEK